MNINELKNTARLILAKHRQNLLNVHPFVGSIAMNLELVPIRDARCNTAMTDGKTIFFDIDFLSKLNEQESMFVLGHEIWHVVMMHFLRGEGKNHDLFNIACDMEVNQLLENDGFVPPTDVIFPNSRHSRKCEYNFKDGLSAEEYYSLLVEYFNNSKNKNSNNESSNNENNENGKRKSNKKSNGCEGQFDSHFDKNVDYEELGKEAMENETFDKYGKKGLDDDFNPGKIKNENDARSISDEIRQMIIATAQSYERSRGELPGFIKKIVDGMLESKMSWKETLAQFITSGFDNKISWNAPNRRFAWSGTYLPKHDGDMMRLAIGLDTSGSCAEECQKFISEVNAIAKTFGSYELHLIQCDTKVQDYQMFDEFNSIEDKVNNIEFKGFGGTILKPVFDYIQLNDIEVSGVLMFTDGYCEDFEDDGSIDLPIMWAITGNNECSNLHIGEKVYIK